MAGAFGNGGGEFFGDVRHFGNDGVEITFGGDGSVASDLLQLLSIFFAFKFGEAFGPGEDGVVLLEIGHGDEDEEAGRHGAHFNLIDDPWRFGFGFLVCGMKDVEGLGEIVLVARREMDFDDTHVTSVGEVDGIGAVAKVVAAFGDDGALAGEQGGNFILHFGEFGMSGIDLIPAGQGLLDVFVGIERIEGNRFGLSGNGLEGDPIVGNIEAIAGFGHVDGNFLVGGGFAVLNFLADENEQVGRSGGRIRRFVLGEGEGGAEKRER